MCWLEVHSDLFGILVDADTNTLTISVNTAEVPFDWSGCEQWLLAKRNRACTTGGPSSSVEEMNFNVQDLGWVKSSQEFKLPEAKDEEDSGFRGANNRFVAVAALQNTRCSPCDWFCCTYASGQQLLLGLDVSVESFEPRIAATYRVPKNRAIVAGSRRWTKILKRILTQPQPGENEGRATDKDKDKDFGAGFLTTAHH
jgi:hypothetical protein